MPDDVQELRREFDTLRDRLGIDRVSEMDRALQLVKTSVRNELSRRGSRESPPIPSTIAPVFEAYLALTRTNREAFVVAVLGHLLHRDRPEQ